MADKPKKIKEVTIKCGYCGHRFPSPIFIGNTTAFDTAITAGNTAQCPKCHRMIHCNQENMTYTLADEEGPGGFVGTDFSDNKA